MDEENVVLAYLERRIVGEGYTMRLAASFGESTDYTVVAVNTDLLGDDYFVLDDDEQLARLIRVADEVFGAMIELESESPPMEVC